MRRCRMRPSRGVVVVGGCLMLLVMVTTSNVGEAPVYIYDTFVDV